ncbi:hypothetical protein BCR35DRAFT_308999 [Leucosporidium creatinivorum]|uniref:MYND-type domain-containing protein n=1 Tax=Leucosporidium creatinivorum TaxID=106004 RepID=A0A1Y2DS17_9BASI|nr:hypothetical protein BCR35DRAFT_308999 [Leucosporidium creatinivorum]
MLDEQRLKELHDSYIAAGGGRPLEELLAGKDKLKGAEAQRLRGAFSSYGLHPADCKQPLLVVELMTGRVQGLRSQFEVLEKEHGKEGAVRLWYDYRDSPNKLPIIDILQIGAWTDMSRSNSSSVPPKYFEALRYLLDLGISPEGTDVAGYTALQHSLTGTPLLCDLKWSQMLLDASADPIAAINHRNRYGGTSAHEIMQSFRRPGEQELRVKCLTFLLEHGANVDIPDGDGSTARRSAIHTAAFSNLIAAADIKQSTENACAFCRRGGVAGKGKEKDGAVPKEDGEIRASLRCGRCKSRMYCSAVCQKLDWAAHKKGCVPAPAATSS